MIYITDHISIPERELSFRYIRASGPGGQNVNKVNTAVQLKFDVGNTQSLPTEVRNRLARLAGRQITEDGILFIDARRFRSQLMNREDAVDRLVQLIKKASVAPVERRPTRTPRQVERKRLENKHHRSRVKQMRRPPGPAD